MALRRMMAEIASTMTGMQVSLAALAAMWMRLD
jgi:hypothetical protein